MPAKRYTNKEIIGRLEKIELEIKKIRTVMTKAKYFGAFALAFAFGIVAYSRYQINKDLLDILPVFIAAVFMLIFLIKFLRK
jgi:hypothetical protein